MVNLQVDESYCIDFISILEVKFSKAPAAKQIQIHDLLVKCIDNLAKQISQELVDEILSSSEYRELFQCNETLFNFFDICKKTKLDAAVPDQWNHRRHQLKQKIQEKFFGNKLTEEKLGYD